MDRGVGRLTAAPHGAELGGLVEPRSFLGEVVAVGVGGVPYFGQRNCRFVGDAGQHIGHGVVVLQQGDPNAYGGPR